MSVDINYWGVVLAGLSSMVVGSLWYMPATFGTVWMKLAKVKPDRSRMSAGQLGWMYGSVLVASLVTAFVLAHLAFLAQRFFGGNWLWNSVTTAVWAWLGFTAARLYVHDTFDERRKQLTVLNAAHELVTLVVMGLIIGWLHP